MNRLFGLIGYPLGHSWSKKYFDNKFHDEKINYAEYQLFPIKKLESLISLLSSRPLLCGLNVTIPYKTAIIPYLDVVDPLALEINAVNTIKIDRNGDKISLQGYNTDVYGFEKSISPMLKPTHKSAMIVGTGGAAKAAAWVFNKNGIDFFFVSRKPSGNRQLGYNELTADLFEKFTIIVNASPLGMMPEVHSSPPLPYHFLNARHLLFDMVYNPAQTVFLKKGLKNGCAIKGGLEMLHLQAEKCWEIWNS